MQPLFINALLLLAVIVVTVLVILGLVKLLFKSLEGDKLTLYLDFTKWIVVSVALVIIATVIDSSLKDREAGINEIKQYDSYVQMVIQTDGIAKRWRLAQYFSKVTASEKLRDRWDEYFKIVEKEYLDSLGKQRELIAQNKYLDSLLNLPQYLNDNSIIAKIETNNLKLQNLSKELNPNLEHPVKLDDASRFEDQGFNFLFDREVDKAIDAFSNAEKTYPSFHNVYEIINLLRKNRSKLSDKKAKEWRIIYQTILDKYSYRLTDDIIETLTQNANQKEVFKDSPTDIN
jgi:hypothetical protein